MRLRDVAGIGCCSRDEVHQPGVGVYTTVRLHFEMPLIALLCLVYLGVKFAAVVLRRVEGRV